MQVFIQNGKPTIHLGDTDVEYQAGFRLYMTTPLANPHFLPEACIKVTLVNFTVTGPGLEEQLLAELLRKERPDLQASKDRLLLSISNDKRQLKVSTEAAFDPIRPPPLPPPPPALASPQHLCTPCLPLLVSLGYCYVFFLDPYV